jgi:hypothetical protein
VTAVNDFAASLADELGESAADDRLRLSERAFDAGLIPEGASDAEADAVLDEIEREIAALLS